MGNTFPLCGRESCPGRSVTSWTNVSEQIARKGPYAVHVAEQASGNRTRAVAVAREGHGEKQRTPNVVDRKGGVNSHCQSLFGNPLLAESLYSLCRGCPCAAIDKVQRSPECCERFLVPVVLPQQVEQFLARVPMPDRKSEFPQLTATAAWQRRGEGE